LGGDLSAKKISEVKSLSDQKSKVKSAKKSHGFIQIPRDVFDLPCFWKKPFTKDRALVYLIRRAVFKNQTIELKRQNINVKIKLNRNEIFTSRHKLREHWGRSFGWIDRFLIKFDSKNLIRVSLVETSLKTKKQVYTSVPYRKRKTGLYQNRETRQLGIRVKLLFLDDIGEMKKQKQVNEILAKQVYKKK